jgi:hypothetical protein
VSNHGNFSKWCPPELTAAAGPLEQVGDLLHELAGSHKGLERLGATSPSLDVQHALAEFVEHWELALWSFAGTASSLGGLLKQAAESYAMHEEHLAYELQQAWGLVDGSVR